MTRWIAGPTVATLLLGGATAAPRHPAPDADPVAACVAHTGVSGGICALVGVTNVNAAAAVAMRGPFYVHMLLRDQACATAMRTDVRAAGLGDLIAIDTYDGVHLPYTDNLLNLLIAADNEGPATTEMLRVLAPLGAACMARSRAPGEGNAAGGAGDAQLRAQAEVAMATFGDRTWCIIKKRWPDNIDEWTHYLHGADGNPVAADRVVGPPRHYQWVSGPLWQRSHESDSSVSTLVTAAGRLFSIIDEAPISLVGDHPLPDAWYLVAQDAFNGRRLWQVPIRRWGWREWKPMWFNYRPGDIPLNIQKRLVAVGDHVYATLGYKAPVTELDARTGDILRTFPATDSTGELLVRDEALIASVFDGDRLRVVTINLSTGTPQWSSKASYAGTTIDYIKWGNQYAHFTPPKLDATLNLACDADAIALIDGADIVCLDASTGAERWRVTPPQDPSDASAGGVQSKGNLWVGSLIVRDGTVLLGTPGKLLALSSADGHVLWEQPKRFIGHLWYEWKDVFVIDGLVWTWGDDLKRFTIQNGARTEHTLAPTTAKAYDLHTGMPRRTVELGSTFAANHHHRCYRNKATERFIIASRRGSEFVNLAGNEHTIDNWVRGTCHLGMMPANGLQYAPPHPCQCYIEEKLTGMNALAPRRANEIALPTAAPAGDATAMRLEKGPAYGVKAADAVTNAPPSSGAAWPTFRGDDTRSGFVNTSVPDAAQPLWRIILGGRITAPSAVGDRLYLSLVNEHCVLCLDARTGREVWAYGTPARVDSQPTISGKLVLFGCADGRVYALRAADGVLAWRFRAAPVERLIGAFDQLESAWPVHGSVLVRDNMVYFVAGRSSELDGGLFLYALDVATGVVRHGTVLDGPHYTNLTIEQNCGLPQGCLPDVLVSNGDNIFMRTKAFNAALDPVRGQPAIRAPAGLLEDSYFKRTPWTYAAAGKDYGRLLVHDNRSVYFVRQFDSLQGLNPQVYFAPGGKGYLLFAKAASGEGNAWSTRIPVRIRAMVATPGRLFVAGPPDEIAPGDPLGAFEGRCGGRLYVYDAANGKAINQIDLPSPPIFNGTAAAAGRLYLAAEDGSLTCFGAGS